MGVVRIPRVAVVGAFVLSIQLIATVVAVVMNWPAQFGGVGTDARAEFLTRGTAISAPGLPLVVLAVASWLATRRDRWGTVGVVLVGLVALLTTVGGLGEALAPATPNVSKEVLVVSGATSVVLAILMLAAMVVELADRRHQNVQAES